MAKLMKNFSHTSVRAEFQGHSGEILAARLDLPAGPVRGYALFAHCFTCSKDLKAVKTIGTRLASSGIAVMRFDFTGLGSSDGEFANTNFSSNVEDLIHAADFLADRFQAPSLLIGHSLGGAAVLAAAGRIESVKGVVTIGAPADVGHVVHLFDDALDEINSTGSANVSLGRRSFTIKKDFIDDVEGQSLADRISKLRMALLVMHAPTDDTVGIENAGKIFSAAKHPKSFVTLDGADHLLTRTQDSAYVARVIEAWADRLIPMQSAEPADTMEDVVVRETGVGKFQMIVTAGRHHMLADEPISVGGLDSGPTPYGHLSAALGACTAMTLRMYADHKRLDIGEVSVHVSHGKVLSDHCSDCQHVTAGATGKIDRFERVIQLSQRIPEKLVGKLIEIANKCPVHKTLEGEAAVITTIANPDSNEQTHT